MEIFFVRSTSKSCRYGSLVTDLVGAIDIEGGALTLLSGILDIQRTVIVGSCAEKFIHTKACENNEIDVVLVIGGTRNEIKGAVEFTHQTEFLLEHIALGIATGVIKRRPGFTGVGTCENFFAATRSGNRFNRVIIQGQTLIEIDAINVDLMATRNVDRGIRRARLAGAKGVVPSGDAITGKAERCPGITLAIWGVIGRCWRRRAIFYVLKHQQSLVVLCRGPKKLQLSGQHVDTTNIRAIADIAVSACTIGYQIRRNVRLVVGVVTVGFILDNR